ncbi:MAG: MoaD/ThiS family protein [Desulfurococcales archaeon]|nr:MoaD/ThiS family protein [Desulfurococcales archaeon]
MVVRIRYFGWLSAEMGNEVTVEVKGGEKIKDIVKLPRGSSIEEFIILKNGMPSKPDDTVSDGDVVSVMPHISGGFLTV